MSEAREPERRRERQAEPENQDSEEATEKREPVGRRDAFSFLHNDQFYVGHCFGFSQTQYELYSDSGYSEDQLLPLQRFDFSTAQWSGVSPVCVDRDRKGKRKRTRFPACGRVCCAVVGDCAYTFGGRWKHGYAVHELNLETFVWQKLEPQNRADGPMRKESAGMVACGGEALCVFGGYGPVPGRHQPGATYHDDQFSTLSTCFTNELHLFHLRAGESVLYVNSTSDKALDALYKNSYQYTRSSKQSCEL